MFKILLFVYAIVFENKQFLQEELYSRRNSDDGFSRLSKDHGRNDLFISNHLFSLWFNNRIVGNMDVCREGNTRSNV